MVSKWSLFLSNIVSAFFKKCVSINHSCLYQNNFNLKRKLISSVILSVITYLLSVQLYSVFIISLYWVAPVIASNYFWQTSLFSVVTLAEFPCSLSSVGNECPSSDLLITLLTAGTYGNILDSWNMLRQHNQICKGHCLLPVVSLFVL